MSYTQRRESVLGLLGMLFASVAYSAAPAQEVGVVSHIKVLSDKVADVSSLEAWKKSFIADGMTDQEKALAIWRSNFTFVFQDAPPLEFLHEGCVHDAIKDFNVYGYGMCCCASARVEQLARYLGLPARGWAINGHSVPEVFWDNQWHMLDASLVNYFTRADKQVASVADICRAVQEWLKEHPGYKGNNGKLTEFQRADGWGGWKKGPTLLTDCQWYDWAGWWPAKTHGWYSTMQEFDGSHNTPFAYEYGYSQGYEVNIQLRRGERLTRNWFQRGQHVNGILKDGDSPGCLTARVGEGQMAFLRNYGDLTDGRIGCGQIEYDVPLANGAFRYGAIGTENIDCRCDDQRGSAVHLLKEDRLGYVEIEMPTSYVYLTGRIEIDAAVPVGGRVRMLLSDNNGLDWRDVASLEKSGKQTIDIQKYVLRRYNYRLRVVLDGKGVGVDSLRIRHDVQCSQRALPALARGKNTISFSAGPPEGTVTIEGYTGQEKQSKQVSPFDFHPVLKDLDRQFFRVRSDGASATFAVATPGEMTRLRLGGHYRLRDAHDRWDIQVSFDGGTSYRTVGTQTGPYQGICQYLAVTDVPQGSKGALVRWVGTQRNTACLFLLRIDADYRQPYGGFEPVKVTYVWEEGGVEKRDVHVARSPRETYKISCAGKPTMKSIAVELAE